MNADFFVCVARYTHKLMNMPAVSASCMEASKAYRRPDLWCGKITVESHMLKTVGQRVHFLRWWFGLCTHMDLHIEVWFALKPLMAMGTEAYDLISAAVLMTRCSHDLFCWGFCMRSDASPLWRTPVGVRELVSCSRSRLSTWVPDDACYSIITDGPVPSRQFSFTLNVYPRDRFPSDPLAVECVVGYVPWPPTPQSLDGYWPMGGLYLDIVEEDLLGSTATFQLCMSSTRALQVRNLSVQKEIHVCRTKGTTLASPTCAYSFYFWSNHNSCTISMCVDDEGHGQC